MGEKLVKDFFEKRAVCSQTPFFYKTWNFYY
jgi:hypothetical protein